MKTCIRCGKSGEKLWLSKSGYCEKCASAILEEQDKTRAITNVADSKNKARKNIVLGSLSVVIILGAVFLIWTLSKNGAEPIQGANILQPSSTQQAYDAGTKTPLLDEESALVLLNKAYSDEDGISYDVKYEDEAYVVYVTTEYTAAAAFYAKEGDIEYVQKWEDIKTAFSDMNDDAIELLESLGYSNASVSFMLMSDEDPEEVLLISSNGEITHDIVAE